MVCCEMTSRGEEDSQDYGENDYVEEEEEEEDSSYIEEDSSYDETSTSEDLSTREEDDQSFATTSSDGSEKPYPVPHDASDHDRGSLQDDSMDLSSRSEQRGYEGMQVYDATATNDVTGNGDDDESQDESYEGESSDYTSEEEDESTSYDSPSQEEEQEFVKRRSFSPTSAIPEEDEEEESSSDEAEERSHYYERVEALQELELGVGEMLKELHPDRKSSLGNLLAKDDDTKCQVAEAEHGTVHAFEKLTKAFLQVSNELELAGVTSNRDAIEKVMSMDALTSALSIAPITEQVFGQLRPVLQHYLYEEEPSADQDDLLQRLETIVRLLTEVVTRISQRQEYSSRAELCLVTLVELLDRTTIEIVGLFEGRPVPDYQLPTKLCQAWSVAGHGDKLEPSLFSSRDMISFRQLCFDVLISTDDWCPNKKELGRVCNVSPPPVRDSSVDIDDGPDNWAPVPPMALEVLDKVQGDPLPRAQVMANILRRILPPEAVTDSNISSEFYNVQGLSTHLSLSDGKDSIVAVSSVPEVWNDPTSIGMSGVGKTTMTAMVTSHQDVRRFYADGVAWVYVGSQAMSYFRYCQCLRDLCSQLEFCEAMPLLPEMVRNPGETRSARARREYGFMLYARDAIASLLHGRRVLVVLDDVEFKSDVDWFRFGANKGSSTTTVPAGAADKDGKASYGVVVITRIRDMLPAADTVEIDLLNEAESIRLLVTESGQPSDHVMTSSREAKSVVRVCGCHPLAVKSVGRWLSLKHATSGVIASVEEIHEEVAHAINGIADQGMDDTMYEILSMAFSPAVNGKPTLVIKFCFSAFCTVFCSRQHHSLFSPIEVQPVIPMALAELLFETLLELEEEKLFQEGSLFFSQRREATMLIPEALSALGVMKVIASSADDQSFDEATNESSADSSSQTLFLQIMHESQREYGEYLAFEEDELLGLTEDAERRWNREFVNAYMTSLDSWDIETLDASRDYAVEMIVSHMLRAEMYEEASKLLQDKEFVKARVDTMGREHATRQHITDCEELYELLKDRTEKVKKRKKHPRVLMERAYKTLGNFLTVGDSGCEAEEEQALYLETGRAQYAIGYSLAEKRSWHSAILHWETSQDLLIASLGFVEFVAAVLVNSGMAFAEINQYEKALSSLKRSLRIRGVIHGEKHILYAQTIQKIGDVFLGMSDYNEAMDSYNWALDVMHIEPDYHRINIGDVFENMGNIHYSKGDVPEALKSYEDSLRSKKVELGSDHYELSTIYQHIGNCLSDQGDAEEAIAHFEEAIRLRKLDPEGGFEQDADILSIEGVLNNLHGRQEQGLHCYEKCLELLVTKVPHRKEKIAALLHLIGCVYLLNGEHKKAMRLFEESLHARQKILGLVHLDVASTLFNMAFLHQMRNRLGKALKCLEEALKIRQLRLPDSEKVALTHEKIGTLSKAVGHSQKAETAFQEALRIRKLVHGEDHELVGAVLHELGDLADDMGDYDQAMRYYAEALDIRRKSLGPDHEDVAATLYSMGFTLHNQDEPERALQCFEEALNIRKLRLGEDSKEVGDTLNMMGFLQAKRGEMDDALSLLWDALRIRKLQEDLIKVCETLKNIGNVHREKREHDLAAECYEECLRIRRTELGDGHEKVADALVAIGNVRSDMEETEAAMQAYKEALTIRTMVHGRNDEKVAAVLQYMGTMEFRSGDFDSAQRYLEEFVRIRRENQAEKDGEFVNVLFMMGNIHKIEGRDLDAKQCWSEAYQVFQDLGLAEENPQLAKVMDSLLQGDGMYDEGFAGASDSKKRGFLNRIMETMRE